MQSFVQSRRPPEAEHKDRQVALEHLAEAWYSAERDGIRAEAVAHAAIFAALATLVTNYGEEAIAELVARLPRRIRAGEYSLDRTVQ